MAQFLLDCCFKDLYKGIKNGILTPRYEKMTRTMPCSAESLLLALLHSTESRLRATRHATQRVIQVKNFLVDSAL
jgi:hypothetical protein